jgi:hypothetical protein
MIVRNSESARKIEIFGVDLEVKWFLFLEPDGVLLVDFEQ